MDEYITLTELYIFNPYLFKTKNLNGFIKTYNVQEKDIRKFKYGIIAINEKWVQTAIPDFNVNIEPWCENDEVYDVKEVLEKVKCKTFNPIALKLNSSMVVFFIQNGQRTPFFTRKGYLKIMLMFDRVEDEMYNWIYELNQGSLVGSLNNLNNIKEMIKADHPPIVKCNGTLILTSHLYDIDLDDTVVDIKKLYDIEQEQNLKNNLTKYKCPVYSQLQLKYKMLIKEMEIKQLQEKLSLTQSMIPQEPKRIPSLKPSKIC
jgi:metal-sulfur cluster biosynthetic enzyme